VPQSIVPTPQIEGPVMIDLNPSRGEKRRPSIGLGYNHRSRVHEGVPLSVILSQSKEYIGGTRSSRPVESAIREISGTYERPSFPTGFPCQILALMTISLP